jgi:ABC-2 type transport system permease protein
LGQKLINALISVNEGLHAAFTNISHQRLYIIYPVLLAFCALFLTIGIRAFRRRVLS